MTRSSTDLVALILMVLSIHVAQGCIHDSLSFEVHSGHQDYGSDHPFVVAERRRRLQGTGQVDVADQTDATAYAPIRITPYYDNSSLDALSSGKRDVLTRIIEAAVERTQRTLQVVPVQGNLKAERPCYRSWDTIPRVCYDVVDTVTCSEMIIPDEHIAATRYCDACVGDDCGSGHCAYSEGGTGVPDTDFVFYVRADDTDYCYDGVGALAYAGPCQKDQFDRPTFGMTNFCPLLLSTNPKDFETQVSTAMHELTHALGFTSLFIPLMRFDDGTPRTPRDEYGNPPMQTSGNYPNGKLLVYPFVVPDNNTIEYTTERDHVVAKLVTPKVAAFVQEHFACPTLAGAEIESYDDSCLGSHWEERLFEPEYMSSVGSFRSVYSALTLAFFEDTGWYRTNASTAERLVFGEKRGCAFATDKCIDPKTGISLEESHYCVSDAHESCSMDATSRSYCTISDDMGAIPEEFQYFPGHPTKGGFGSWGLFPDFCPLNIGAEWGDCMNEANLMPLGDTGMNMYGETYCPTCKCTKTTLRGIDSIDWVSNAFRQTGCYPMQCFVNGADDTAIVGLTIRRTMTNDTVQVNCTTTGEELPVPGFSGTISCPDPFIICGVGWPAGSVIDDAGSARSASDSRETGGSSSTTDAPDAGTLAPTTTKEPTATPTPTADTTVTTPSEAFAGHYTRVALYPITCGWPSVCNFECSEAYFIVVSNKVATIVSTAAGEDCSCGLVTASVSGDSALGASMNATFVLSLTSTGIMVEANQSGATCTGVYTHSEVDFPSIPSAPTSSGSSGLAHHVGAGWVAMVLGLLLLGTASAAGLLDW